MKGTGFSPYKKAPQSIKHKGRPHRGRPLLSGGRWPDQFSVDNPKARFLDLSIQFQLSEVRRMATPTTTLPPRSTSPLHRWLSKYTLWAIMGAATLFVFVTTEIFLLADYRLYHSYRVQLIQDRALLIPHAIAGTLAFLAGPLQFSSRLRARYRQFHRVLGRIYVVSVLTAATFALFIDFGREEVIGVAGQAALWILCTLAAFITARNRHIAIHRQWMIRSYAITFTFIVNRLLNLWPAYFNLTGRQFAFFDIYVCIVMLVGCDLAFSFRELTTRRSA
jgi:uncharacterized membrane protein